VAVDLTLEMLTRGRDLSRAQGLTNIRFEQAAVERLPFAEASFDAVGRGADRSGLARLLLTPMSACEQTAAEAFSGGGTR